MSNSNIDTEFNIQPFLNQGHLDTINHLIKSQQEPGHSADTLVQIQSMIDRLGRLMIKDLNPQEFKEKSKNLLEELDTLSKQYETDFFQMLSKNEGIGGKEYLKLENPMKLLSSCLMLVKHLEKNS